MVSIPSLDELRIAKKALLGKSDPLRKQLADIRKQLAPLEKKKRDLKQQIQTIEMPALGELNAILAPIERKEAKQKARDAA